VLLLNLAHWGIDMSSNAKSQPVTQIIPGVRITQANGIAPQPSSPQPVMDEAVAGLRMLLQIEANMRAVGSRDELASLCVNELGRIIRARQVFYADVAGSKARIRQATGVVKLDTNAPTVRWVEDELNTTLKKHGPARVLFEIAPEAGIRQAAQHPLPYALWLPLLSKNKIPIGGLLALRESEWSEGDILLAERLAGTAAHAASILNANAKAPRRAGWKLPASIALSVALVVAMAWPVAMTALAPVEVMAVDAFVIAAPLDGIVERITVPQNAAVKPGDEVVRYVDTVLRNQLQVAEREVEVAKAKLSQAIQNSFVDDKARREIGQFRAELTTKMAELDFARETFEKTRIRAPRSGIAVFEDAKEWLGKPVAPGTRIMEIVDPDVVEARIDLPVADGMVADTGGRVRLFLDSDPLHPLEAKVTSASYHARTGEGGALAYRLIAQLAPGTVKPRLGMRGTAEVYAKNVPFGFYLFRRPLSWLRQKAGM
jgi:hypothetical protein